MGPVHGTAGSRVLSGRERAADSSACQTPLSLSKRTSENLLTWSARVTRDGRTTGVLLPAQLTPFLGGTPRTPNCRRHETSRTMRDQSDIEQADCYKSRR